jgi:hypothetical protein
MDVARTLFMVGALAATFVVSGSGEKPTIGGKPNLSGAWQMESSTAGDQSPTWTITQLQDTIRIKESVADRVTTDVECSTRAVDCATRVDGKEASVTFYFNGPVLVQFTRKGKDVTKVRRTLSEDGQKLTMEVTPYVPAGDPKTVILVRTAGQVEGQSSANVK